ncbi:hypothetical protein JQK87_04870 [Streptomyces sp. G44]|uniref:hypothetical protein n=1 Tax=Streptomyces sp. G44 TaxID=2807632 RepID=UPI001961B25F|nr:hypothetical protein [Streptomyces sp. G44]MBM7167751.1 hypothetical protein [Streptomyces sp. G44]
MSTTSPMPVLRASDGALLRFDGNALVLRRKAEEVRIPLLAIECIRSEGRSLVVDLTAPSGMVPSMHRIDDVSKAAADLFAEAVNAALPERPANAEGSKLVITRAVTESQEERDKRRRRGWGTAVVLVCAGLAAAVAAHGVWTFAFIIMLVGPVGALLTAIGADMVRLRYRSRYLLRHGVTVEARRVSETRVLGGEFGMFVYTDMHGVERSVNVKSRSATVQVVYHPAKPGIVTEYGSRASRASDTVAALCFLVFGLIVDATVIGVAIGSFQGMYPGY